MPNYRLWFDPEFDYDAPNVRREHATSLVHRQDDPHIRKDVEGLVASFKERLARGLPPMINPLFVTVYEGFYSLHPGKCRAKALKLLGFTSCPALIYAPSGYAYHAGTELSPSAAAKLFTGESFAEYDDRWFAVKRLRVGRDGRALPGQLIER